MNSNEQSERFADVRKHLPFFARHEGAACLFENVLGYPRVRKAFAASAGARNPFASAAQELGLAIRIEGPVDRIPRSGPIIFVANHAHGGADALALMAMARDLRDDVRVLANREVGLLPGVAPYLFPVSILGGPKARENTSSLRGLLRHVRQGGCLVVFPAGRVAYWQGDRMIDPPWNHHVVKILQHAGGQIVPVCFFGSPPAAVNILSRFSPFLRTALIPTGLARMGAREITARVGLPIPGEQFPALGEGTAAWLRAEIETLRNLGN